MNARIAAEIKAVKQSDYTIQPIWCQFSGITCGTTSGTISYASVISIDLTRCSLRGEIPSTIGNFPSLTSLILTSNDLEGALPMAIEKLTTLKV